MMIQVSLLLFLAPAVLAVRSGDAENPVRKVVTLLEDMKAQVEKDAAADKEAYDKYACWCETNKGEKTEAVAKAKERITDLEAVIEEAIATAAQMKTEIAEHKKAIEEDRDSLAAAEANRAEENEAFAKESADLRECISGLTKALEVLSKVQLLQKQGHGRSSPKLRVLLLQARSELNGIHSQLSKFRGVMQKDLWDMMGVLKVGGGSAFLGHHDALTQEDLFQPEEKSEEELGKEAKPTDLTGAAAGSKSYNSRSGEIYGLLEKMNEGFKESLAAAEKQEAAQLKTYEELRKAKLSEIALATEQVSSKEARLAGAQATEAQAKEDIQTTTASLSADEKFLLTLEEDCTTADEEYSARAKSRNEETIALSEAIAILSEDDARDLYSKTLSFLQVVHQHQSVVTSVSAEETARNQLVNKAMQRLLRSARQNKDWMLASLAVRVRLDAFTKVKELMDKMIAELKVQQKEEVEKKDFCNKEIDTTEDQIKTGKNEEESLEATKVKLEGDFATYTATLETLSADLADMQVSLKKIGEERAAENMVYQQDVADQRATIHILQKAEARLEQYYASKASFVQQDPPPPTGTGSYEKSSSAGHVLQLLADVIKDATLAEKEMVVDEKSAQKAYESMVKDMNDSIFATEAAITENTKHKDATAGEQAETEGALLAKTGEISNLEEELSSIHAGCDYVLKYFDVRQAARSQEMEAIAEAKAILSGASFGAALMQGDQAAGSA